MRKVFDFFLGVFLFLTATAYIPGKPFSQAQENVFQIGVCALFIISLFLTPLRQKTNKWLNVAIGICFLTFLTLPENARMFSIAPLVFAFMGIALFYTVIQHSENIYAILNGICFVVLINAGMVLAQALGVDPICLNDAGQQNTHMVGLFGFKYVMGAWMAVSTSLLIFNKRKFFGALAAILTVCSLSWASIGLMLFSLVFASFFLNRRLFIAAITAAVITGSCIYFFVLRSPGNKILTLKYKIESRLHLESKFLGVLMSKPLTGYGLGSFKQIGPTIVNNKTGIYGTMTDAWNDYLERGIDCGLAFPVVMVLMFWEALRRFLRSRKDPSLIGVASGLIIVPFGMMFHNYMDHFSVTSLLLVVFALFEIKEGCSENKVCRE